MCFTGEWAICANPDKGKLFTNKEMSRLAVSRYRGNLKTWCQVKEANQKRLHNVRLSCNGQKLSGQEKNISYLHGLMRERQVNRQRAQDLAKDGRTLYVIVMADTCHCGLVNIY